MDHSLEPLARSKSPQKRDSKLGDFGKGDPTCLGPGIHLLVSYSLSLRFSTFPHPIRCEISSFPCIRTQGPLNTYSFSTLCHGSSYRSRGNASHCHENSFSFSSSFFRAAVHSSCDAIKAFMSVRLVMGLDFDLSDHIRGPEPYSHVLGSDSFASRFPSSTMASTRDDENAFFPFASTPHNPSWPLPVTSSRAPSRLGSA